MTRNIIAAAVISLCASSAGAAVHHVSGYTDATDTYTPIVSGHHWLELRDGRNGAHDWKMGEGRASSARGGFGQGHKDWGSVQTPALFNFDLIYSGFGSIGAENAESRPWTTDAETPAVSARSACAMCGIFQGLDSLTQGQGLGQILDQLNSGGGMLPKPGGRLAGTNHLITAGGEQPGVFVKTGNVSSPVAPVPLPAALPLLLAGIGGLAWVSRRRA